MEMLRLMSSYPKHILFSLIMAFPFFQDPFYLSLAVVGASLVDLDQWVRIRNLLLMNLWGVLLIIGFYLFNIPLYLGAIFIVMSVIFLISRHRGTTHSLTAMILIGAFLAQFVQAAYLLLQGINLGPTFAMILIALILGFLTLKKKIFLFFALLVPLGIIIMPKITISIYAVFLALLLGYLSHLILDLFTPQGLELFKPISSKKCSKGCGAILLLIWGLSWCSIIIFKIKLTSPASWFW